MDNSDPFIVLWSDNTASLRGFSNCIKTDDIFNDGDYRLMVADINRTIRVYKGTYTVWEQNLIEIPVGVVTIKTHRESRNKLLAVACGSNILFFTRLNNYYRFEAPLMPPCPEETQAWERFKSNNNLQEFREVIQKLQEKTIPISSITLRHLSHPDCSVDSLMAVDLNSLKVSYSMTYMTTIKKLTDFNTSPDYIVVGNECKQLFVIECVYFKIINTIDLPSVCYKITTQGSYDIDSRIFVACRNNNVYIIKNGKLTNIKIECELFIVDMVMSEKYLFIALMNNTVHAYTLDCTQQWVIELKHSIFSICPFESKTHTFINEGLLISTSNNEILLYDKSTILSTISLKTNILGMYLGKFGREDGCLITTSVEGAVDARILSRRWKPSNSRPTDENTLVVPKKTKIFVEMMNREKDKFKTIYNTFMQDLDLIKFELAKGFQNSQNSENTNQISINIQMEVEVLGVGPDFILNIFIVNYESTTKTNMRMIMDYNADQYEFPISVIRINVLIPQLKYEYKLNYKNLSEAGSGGFLKVCLVKEGETSACFIKNVQLPQNFGLC